MVTCLVYALFSALAIGLNELYPLWAATSKKYSTYNVLDTFTYSKEL